MSGPKLRPLFVMSAIASAVVLAIETAHLVPGGKASNEITLATALLFLIGSLASLNVNLAGKNGRG